MNVPTLGELSTRLSKSWPTIERAQSDARKLKKLLRTTLSELQLDTDVDFVVFGSLAREEWTSGSDVDWTLLIDGQVDVAHQRMAHRVREALSDVTFKEKPLVAPGATGVFGNLTFSHDLVHLIGGDTDTNHNLTRRVLLLLESAPILERELSAYDRVIKTVIDRYIYSDANIIKSGSAIPRFLVNDIVRYWRTLCVDFAWKEWKEAGDKWALRNVKLRMSRKLMFAAGMFMAFNCELRQIDSEHDDHSLAWSSLISMAYRTPIEIASHTLNHLEQLERLGRLLDHYESFLVMLDNKTVRESLKDLTEERAYDDQTFLRLREISHEFQDVLTEIFFDLDTPLGRFTSKYGVF